MGSLKAYHRSRPVRVAFLVEEHADYAAMLDAVFADCHSRWGGRFNLVIPCENGEPIAGYDKWLYAYDPDVVYSYIDLSEKQIERFHETYFPSFLVRHDFLGHGDERTRRAFRPSLPIDALTSLSVVGMIGRSRPIDHQSVKLVVDRAFGVDTNRFLEDSFGSFAGAFGRSPFPRVLSDVARAVTVAPPEIVNRRHGYTDKDETVPTVTDLLAKMTDQSLVTFSQLSAAAVPRQELSESKWSRAFSIVVGDSFIDRVIYWNARSLYPLWRDDDLVSLCIPTPHVDDDEFLRALAGLLYRKNHVSGHGGGSQPSVTIRSNEINTDVLNVARNTMQEIDKWSQYSVDKILDVGDCAPDAKDWERSSFLRNGGGIGSGIQIWGEAVYEGNELRIAPEAPDHLRYIPTFTAGTSQGAWAVDLDIEREANYSGISNVQHRWRLPRRLRLVSAFAKSYQISGSMSQFVAPRSNADGLLTLFATVESQFPTIRVPTDEEAFISALTAGRDWWPFVTPKHGGDGMPNQLCTFIRPSTQGRYFAGVLGIFGGLERAREVLLHELWDKLFEKMGASSKTTDTQISEIQKQLLKRFSSSTIDLAEAKQIEALSKEVLKTARQLRIEPSSLSWSEIETAFDELHDAYWKEHHPGDENEDEESRDDDRDRFARSVQKLCAKGSLHQGIRWKCRSCFHESWVSIGSLNTEIECEVCGKAYPAPIKREWDFMLNSFLATALREHGIQSIVWALVKPRNMVTSSFYFFGPSDVYLDKYPEDVRSPDGDIDLICVQDGVVRCCEVKQSSRNLDLDNFVKLVKRLRPNIATLAVMEGQNSKIDKAFRRLKEGVSGTGIDAELIVLEPADIDSSPNFGTIRYRVF